MHRAVFIAAILIVIVLALAPVSPAVGLACGVAVGIAIGRPFGARTKHLTKLALGVSVAGLGAGVELARVLRAGAEGFIATVIGITACLALGELLRRLLRVPKRTGLLIAVGTAICGGSAIAAVAPVIEADEDETSVALATVFVLNGVALLVFPPIGHWLGLDQQTFGTWAALAIHDTSSVVGAGLAYGSEALMIATAVKLARALWIVPLTFVASALHRRQTGGGTRSIAIPWPVVGFIASAALVAVVPALAPLGHTVAFAATRLMVVTLFLVGTSLTRATLATVGVRPMVQGVALWLIVAGVSLAALMTLAR